MSRVKLKDIAVEKNERVDNPSQSPYSIFVGLEHYDSGEATIRRYGSTERLESTMKVFHAGDILIARRNVYLKRAATVDFDGLTSGDSIVLHVENEAYRRIVPFVLNTDDFWDYANQHADGSMSKRLSPKLLLEYEFSLPEDDLELVSDILWGMERVKQSYQKLISKTDELVKSQFIEMFGDPVLNEKGWPMVRLDTLAEVKIGPFGSLLHREDYIEGGHALINPSHILDGKIVIDPKLTISEDKFQELSSYILHIGDVVLGRRGEMGRCAVVKEEGYLCGTGSMILRSGAEMKPYFLQNILASPTYRRIIEDKAVGVTMMNINVPIVSGLMIPKLPLGLQEQYLELVKQSDKSKFAAQQALNEITASQKALMKRIFE